LREEDAWYVTERVVRETARIRFKAIMIGAYFLIGYIKDGDKYRAVVGPRGVDQGAVLECDNFAEFADALVKAVKHGVGDRVENVEVDATLYVVEQVRINKHSGKVVSGPVIFHLIEWGEGALYAVKLYEGEVISLDGP